MASDDGPAAVDSIWWYVVAFAGAWGVLAWVLFLLYLGSAGTGTGPSAELTVLSIAVLAVHPLALYLDIGAVERSGVDWTPSARLYVAAAVVGVPATVFTSFVAAVYLYRRHRHVGTP